MKEISRPAREEQALREVGRTEVRRAVAWGLVLGFLVTAVGVLGAEQVGVALSAERRVWPAWGELGTRFVRAARDEGLAGANRVLLRESAAFEERLEEGSLLVERVVPWAQWLETALLGTGNRQAYVGRPAEEGGRWLQYRPDVEYLVGRPFLDPEVLEARRAAADSWREPVRPDPRPAILDLRRQLARRGIELVVVPTPVKPGLHPEGLTGTADGPAASAVPLQNPSFHRLVRELEAAGVRVLDPAPLLAEAARATGEPQYLVTDSHWTPAAMERVAEALARRMEPLLAEATAGDGEGAPSRSPPGAGPGTRSGSRPDGRAAAAPEAGGPGYRRQPARIRGTGDLARMLRLPEAPGLPELFPPQEVTVHQVLDATGGLLRPDPKAPVLLLGDSFTNVYSQPELGWGQGAGLAEQLAYRLGRPVDRIALNAGGAHASRERLARILAGDPGRLASKRVVVYQFAVRELAAGDWRLVELDGSPEGPRGRP
ncbi:MAG: alginate O-acetyltransferase AlgX-related protein [Thermoanaerobaculia bacterium]